MMKNLKYLLFIVSILLLAPPATAQFGIGAGLSYGIDLPGINKSEIGLFGRANYQFFEQLRAGATFNVFLDNSENITYWNLDLEGNYFFHRTDVVRVYALAGLTLATINVDVEGSVFGYSNNNTELGLLAGAGIEYKVTDTIRPIIEIKYDAGGFDQFVFNLGVLYIFQEY